MQFHENIKGLVLWMEPSYKTTFEQQYNYVSQHARQQQALDAAQAGNLRRTFRSFAATLFNRLSNFPDNQGRTHGNRYPD